MERNYLNCRASALLPRECGFCKNLVPKFEVTRWSVERSANCCPTVRCWACGMAKAFLPWGGLKMRCVLKFFILGSGDVGRK